MKKTKLEEIDFENDLLEVSRDVLGNLRNSLNCDTETKPPENLSLCEEWMLIASMA